jgi:hypothetical protein
MVPFTSNVYCGGFVVPIPTLLPLIVIGELVRVTVVSVVLELGPKTGTVPTEVVPDICTLV